MNIILKRTHMKSNIKSLKARDYYFDIAKKLNQLISNQISSVKSPFPCNLTYSQVLGIQLL